VSDPKLTAVPVSAPATMPAFTKEQEAYIQQLTVATAMAVMQSMQGQAVATRKNHVAPEECIVCKQARSACKDKHTKMIVYPIKYPEYGPYFLGVKINGIKYLSYDENYAIDVPSVCVSTITNAVNAFEMNEKTIHVGRNKTHQSGSIGKHGTGFNKAEAAWR
jgi:hypothetical protein